MSAVRDDTATTTCAMCSRRFRRLGRQRFCSTVCRQSAWRRQRSAPAEPVVAKSDTVYECPECDARYLGEQRCPDCNTWARRIGPGGPCPSCDEPIARRRRHPHHRPARPGELNAEKEATPAP